MSWFNMWIDCDYFILKCICFASSRRYFLCLLSLCCDIQMIHYINCTFYDNLQYYDFFALIVCGDILVCGARNESLVCPAFSGILQLYLFYVCTLRLLLLLSLAHITSIASSDRCGLYLCMSWHCLCVCISVTQTSLLCSLHGLWVPSLLTYRCLCVSHYQQPFRSSAMPRLKAML